MPRQPEEPSPQQVFEAMMPCEPYTAAEIADMFENTSRWTVHRRLESLYEEDKIRRKKHSNNRVSWWRWAHITG
jgi:predicted HTH transcriptional regulator